VKRLFLTGVAVLFLATGTAHATEDFCAIVLNPPPEVKRDKEYNPDAWLGRVDGFDQDEAESKRDERTVIPRCLLAAQCDALESFELADCLLDTGAAFVENSRKEGGNVFGVGSIRDGRAYSALTRGLAI
jgi:hypothetical protein